MPIAYLAIREGVHYRRDAFHAGLQRCGFKVVPKAPSGGGQKGDLFIAWNRYGQNHRIATIWEQQGLPVIIAENGYLGDQLGGRTMMAMSRSHHNGAGFWPQGGPERWDSYGIELKPWRQAGDPRYTETVILPQRGIGPPGVAMPLSWTKSVQHLGRVRKHPGENKTVIPLEQDLAKASRVVIWGSGAGIKALMWGIPVYYAFPKWIGAQAACPIAAIGRDIPAREDADRLAMFRRLAWAQWTLDEITSGEAIKQLLECKP